MKETDAHVTGCKPVILCILDGWGLREEREGNAPALAETPHYDRLMAAQNPAMLACSGPDVGLPEGQMGNSEVGHMNIGAGRIVWMDLPKIDRAIEDGSFAANPALAAFCDKLKASNGTAHLMGLMSAGGVHAHQRHIAAAAKAVAEQGVPVRLHLFTDGRDTPPKSAAGYLEDFLAELGAPPDTRIATLSGRFYAMDRDKRWERIAAAYGAIAHGVGERAADAGAAIAAAYERGETDEFIAPTVIGDYAGAAGGDTDGDTGGDGVLFLNFRADRAREILATLGDPDFANRELSILSQEERAKLSIFDKRPRFAAMTGLVEYSDRHNEFMSALMPSARIANTLGAWLAAQGATQLRLAETEKYPHVTFFLNGGEETPSKGEDRKMAQSPKVKTYDLAPEMAAKEVTAALVAGISGGAHDLVVVNFANPDMVGHTGDLGAAIRACEAVDSGLGAALDALKKTEGAMIVTADHGNCEQMIDPATGGPHTAHTTTPVAALLAGGPAGARLAPANDGTGRLADLAPTLLELMGLDAPPEMTGASLLRRETRLKNC